MAQTQTDYMVLVNATHRIDPHYVDTIRLVEMPKEGGGSCLMEERTAAAYRRLRAASEAAGYPLRLFSSYRSIEQQERTIANYTATRGAEYARRIAAEPGKSEHHTGLAVDFVPMVNGEWVVNNEELIALDDVFSVIHAMLPEFGFILRFPRGKEAITGVGYEPWHIRYLDSVPVAREITRRGLTLEEYLLERQGETV